MGIFINAASHKIKAFPLVAQYHEKVQVKPVQLAVNLQKWHKPCFGKF